MNKSKFVTVIMSIVPGLGHLYLGWMERGMQFMIAFFFSLFLMEWLNISLFAYMLPVIWFYSLFDALQHFGSEAVQPAQIAPWSWLADKQRWVGFGLIAIGALILINRMAIPWLQTYLSYNHIRMISAGLVALLFIAGGIRLVIGKPLPVEREHGCRNVSKPDEGSDR
ncbi:MAG: hypothetical protein AB1767_01530 [Bacillota bacterium]